MQMLKSRLMIVGTQLTNSLIYAHICTSLIYKKNETEKGIKTS
jgi:hypothetical protein